MKHLPLILAAIVCWILIIVFAAAVFNFILDEGLKQILEAVWYGRESAP